MRLDTLTAYRFVAAVVVVVSHASGLLKLGHREVLASLASLGVAFFFVLSGFVLTWSWSAFRSPGRFYWLRFARIWPLHALTAAIALALGFTATTGVVLLNLGLLQAWSGNPIDYWSLNQPAWTLSCEAFFYALFPVLVTGVRRLSNRALTLTAAGGVAAGLTLVVAVNQIPALWANGGYWTSIFPPSRLPEFVIGICAATAVQRGLPVPGNPGVYTAVTAALIVASEVTRQAGIEANVWAPLTVAALALLIATTARDEAGKEWQVPRPLVWLGVSSYALYLTHWLALDLIFSTGLVEPTNEWWGLCALLVIVLPICVASAAVTHAYFERPIEGFLRSRGAPTSKRIETGGRPTT